MDRRSLKETGKGVFERLWTTLAAIIEGGFFYRKFLSSLNNAGTRRFPPVGGVIT